MKPQDVDEAELAFPGDTARLLPPWKDIPEEFKRHNGTVWNKLVGDWFFCGLSEVKLVPKDGIDQKKAMRHLQTIMRSWEPKHEHKEAGVAYLLSQWFEDNPTWTAKTPKAATGH